MSAYMHSVGLKHSSERVGLTFLQYGNTDQVTDTSEARAVVTLELPNHGQPWKR